MSPTLRIPRFLLLLALVWLVAMTWRLYPQFKDAVRSDGRLTTVDDYVSDACSERVGPAATTCLAEARAESQRLLRREQSKSILFIEAPLLLYLVIYLPGRYFIGARRRRTTTT